MSTRYTEGCGLMTAKSQPDDRIDARQTLVGSRATLHERSAGTKGVLIGAVAGLTALLTLAPSQADAADITGLSDTSCVEGGGRPATVYIHSTVSNFSDHSIEAKQEAPPFDNIIGEEWTSVVAGDTREISPISTGETSIPETEVTIYGRRDGEPKEVIERSTVGPKDCEDHGPDHPIHTEEKAGNTPAGTAEINSRRHFADGGARTAVVATDQAFADALAGGPLAGAVNGPILYSGPDNLYDVTANELERLGTQEVLLLGGEAALSAQVEQRLRDMGIDVTRLAGPTRIETAVAIDEYMNQHTEAASNEAFLVNGWKYADAVTASGLAAQEGAPIQLTTADQLSERTRQHLEGEQSKIDTVTAIGGTAVVQSPVLRGSGDAAGADTDRLSGENRFQTSEAVATADFDRRGNEAQDVTASVYMAPADVFHGALVAAPLEARQNNAALMLIPKENLDLLSSFQRVVEGYKHTSWEDAIISGDVGGEVQQEVDSILDNTSPVD